MFLIVSVSSPYAERGGFEPPIPFWSIHAFQACLFNHSSISPFSTEPEIAANLHLISQAQSVFSHKCILFFTFGVYNRQFISPQPLRINKN